MENVSLVSPLALAKLAERCLQIDASLAASAVGTWGLQEQGNNAWRCRCDPLRLQGQHLFA